MKRRWLGSLLVAAAAACTGSGIDSVEQAAKVPHANIDLDTSNARIFQSADTTWSLTKTGSVDTAARTVTWTIQATPSMTTTNHLVISGTMRVKNTGNAGATIGNVVVSLETQNHGWVTASSDVADATSGDQATVANTDDGTVSENSASGPVQLTDAHNNSVFSLVPEVVIAPGHIVALNFSASFDNNILGLTRNTKIRSVVAISFGNHGPNGHATANVDINGNGIIDPDEAYVRTVTDREELRCPSASVGNTTATLTDTAADITTTGTASFSNPSFNVGATSGTVRVSYDGGAHGGDITNCAHLHTSGGQTIDACNTQTIGANACTAGAPGCGWKDGDVVTYTQDQFGTPTTPAGVILDASYATLFPGGVEVGIPGAAGFSMIFSDQFAVYAYLPQLDVEGVLTTDLVDPTTSSSGSFGGDVLALALDVALADHGLLGASSSVAFGDLRLCALTDTPALNGITVRDFLGDANTLLGGGTTAYGLDLIAPLATNLADAFTGGSVSTFAQQHVFSGSCP
jgi:hypothetical protein